MRLPLQTKPSQVSAASPPSRELKFVFPSAMAQTIARWIQLRCRPDPEHPDGIVSSIYYDSPDEYSMACKLNSDFIKTKIRWRWYSDAITGVPGNAAFLEVKTKTGATRNKLRIPTGRTGAWLNNTRLADPRLLEACELLLRNGVIPQRAWYPVFQITYRRKRFIEPCTGGRLCIDTNISAPRAHPRLAARVFHAPLSNGVIEFKTPLDELPAHLHQITAMGCRREAFSKYMACFQRLRESA